MKEKLYKNIDDENNIFYYRKIDINIISDISLFKK